MKLVLYLDPSAIEIGEELSAAKMPYLSSVGVLRMQARAGYISGLGVGQTPSLTVTLDNCANAVADIIGQPLRKRADVLNDDGTPHWQGVVADISVGRTINLTIGA